MKKLVIISILLLSFVLLISNDLSYKIPQVLVIQSYHSGFLWTDNINNGIKTTLKKYNNNVRIRTEFLDTKRFTTQDYRENLKMMLEYKYKDSSFDVVIVADNNAFELVKELHDTVFANTPVVFCGLNFFHPSQLGDMKNVTGVREKIVSLENFELIKKIHKNVEKIIVINEMTPTGVQNRINIMSDIRDFKDDIEIEIVEDISVADLKEKLRNLSPNTVVLYSLFLKDNLGRFLEYDESILLVTEASNVPVYVSIDFSLGYGAIGGFLTSGTLQGESAANLAIKILQGEKADKLGVIDISPNSYYFDYKALQRWGIKLSSLPKNFKIINYEESYFTKHKEILFRFLSIFIVLSGIIFWLTITLVKKNRLKNDLLKSNESLTNLKKNLEIIVKDRTIELEEERNFIRTVQDNEDTLVIVFDKDGVIYRVNRSAIINLEFDANGITGKSLWQVFEEESDIADIEEYIKNSNKNNLNMQLKLVSNKGKRLIVESVINTIVTKGGEYYVLTGTNITEKYHLFKRIEREEKKYRSVYDNGGIAMVTFAENNIVTMVNNKFEELSGFTKDEIVNKMNWQAFVEESEIKRLTENRELRFQNKLPMTDNYEIKIHNKQGVVLDVLLNVVMVPETKELICSITDITFKNAIQNKMKHLLEEQKAFNEAKNNFYNNFGQDIVTPINSLNAFVDLIKNTKDDTEIDNYLDILQNLTNQLLYIVQEMTKYQLDSLSQELVVEKCNLSQFLTYTTEILIQRSNISEIYFSIDDGVKDNQYLDVNKLEKIFEILLIKLAKSNPSIPIFIDILLTENDNIKFVLLKDSVMPKNRNYIQAKGEKNKSILNLEYLSSFRFNELLINNLIRVLGGQIEDSTGFVDDNKCVFNIKRFTSDDVSKDIPDVEPDNNIHTFILPNDASDYTLKSIENLQPLKVLIVNYNNISHLAFYKILDLLNQKIDICKPEQDLKELINKTTYDVIFFDLSVMSINNLRTLKELRLLKNIYQPYVIGPKLSNILGLSDIDVQELYDLINGHFPDILSISNIAFILEAAIEYKNSNI